MKTLNEFLYEKQTIQIKYNYAFGLIKGWIIDVFYVKHEFNINVSVA